MASLSDDRLRRRTAGRGILRALELMHARSFVMISGALDEVFGPIGKTNADVAHIDAFTMLHHAQQECRCVDTRLQVLAGELVGGDSTAD
jgi:hypothetical protein